MYRKMCIASACTLLTIVSGAAAQLVNQIPGNVSTTPNLALEPLGLTGGSLVHLDVRLVDGQPTELVVPINGENRTLKLAPHSVRAPGFRLIEVRDGGEMVDVDAGPVNTFRGTVDKDLRAVVAGGMMPDGLWATVMFSADEQYWIEPVAGRIPGAPADLYVIYTASQVQDTGASCGVDAARHQIGERFGGGYQERGSNRYTAQVAVEADWEYFNLYGSTSLVSSRVNLVYNVMNVQYERDVDIVHTLSSIIVNTSLADPYNQTTTGGMLDEMRLFWVANRAGVTRDVAHLFTGKPTGGVIGTAYLGVICSGTFGYGVSQTEFANFNLASACDVVAHETGHNWNACHCACVNPNFTMNPFITAINRFGSVADECNTNSISAISAHRNSRGCLATGSDTGPVNNACASAATIGPGTWGFSNVSATTDGPAGCGSIGADVWYLYTAPHDGIVSVSTCGTHDATGFDTVLEAFTGGCASLTSIICNDDNIGQCGSLDGGTRRDAYISFPVTRNTQYRIRVGGFGGATGSGQLNFNITGCASPSNNDCANARVVGDGAFAFSTICADTDGFVDDASGCTAFSYFQTGSDIWFRYTASCSGQINASICGADRNFDTRIAVYSGCPTGPNQAIACNDDGCGTGSSLTWSATAGATYLVRVGGYSGVQGTGTLVINPIRPLNDSCSNATPIALNTSATGSTSCASNDGTATCAASQTSPDVWYSFTPLCGGIYQFDTIGAGTDYDTALSVHTGCPGTLNNQIACDDDSGGNLRSRVRVSMVGGTTFFIRVTGFFNRVGSYQLNVSEYEGHNACSTPFTLGNGTTGFNNVGATTDGSPAGICLAFNNNQVSQDIWYIYTASCNGNVQISTCGSNFDTKVAVYNFGTCPASAPIACNDDSCELQSNVNFEASAGQNFIVRVGGFGNASGCGVMNVSCTTPCPWQADGCYADYNNDDSIDGDDVIAFFSAWDANSPCADATGDESTDGDDVINFFTSWDQAGTGFPGC